MRSFTPARVPAPLVLRLQDPGQAPLDPVRKRTDLLRGLPAQRCQPVFHVGRNHFISDPVDQAVAFQPLQRLRQHQHQHEHAPAAGGVLEYLARGAGGHEELV